MILCFSRIAIDFGENNFAKNAGYCRKNNL